MKHKDRRKFEYSIAILLSFIILSIFSKANKFYLYKYEL